MKIVLVCGNFDNDGGRPSKIMDIVENQLIALHSGEIMIFNGGYVKELYDNIIMSIIDDGDIVLWFPNIDNSEDKVVKFIKQFYPKSILVTSKVNTENKYSYQELVAHALNIKSNLFIELLDLRNSQMAIGWTGTLYDPLGNCWCEMTDNFMELTQETYLRAMKLKEFTRQSAKQVARQVPPPDLPEFYKRIISYADIFHDLIKPADEVKRFLGNASFRCMSGFPSFRSGELIFVSRRNIDKRNITKENFVPVSYNKETNELKYYGDHKPSVDTPIQVRLYDVLPKVKYIIHSHVYANTPYMTKEMIPCGAVEEFDAILEIIRENALFYNFAINLKGHGSIVLAKDVGYFDTIKFSPRNVPEVMYNVGAFSQKRWLRHNEGLAQKA